MIALLRGSRTIALAIGVVIVANTLALAGVAYNRSATQATLALSELELGFPFSPFAADRDDSGLSLEMEWRGRGAALPTYASMHRGPVGRGGRVLQPLQFDSRNFAWLDSTRLSALGFDARPRPIPPGERGVGYPAPRPAWFVLELAGPEHARTMTGIRTLAAQAESMAVANPGVDSVQRALTVARGWVAWSDTVSRLYVVDVGRDADALRRSYADPARHAIVPGTVRIVSRDSLGMRYYEGRVDQIPAARINVPRRWRPLIDSLTTGSAGLRSRALRPVTVTIAIGRRGEPWIQSVRPK